MRLRCRFGWHRWGDWGLMNDRFVQGARCLECGLMRLRRVEEP